MPKIDFPAAHVEPHWIDTPERETKCDGCGCPLVCGDKGYLDLNTFVVGCCIPCVEDQNRRVAEHMADVKCAEQAGKGGRAAK